MVTLTGGNVHIANNMIRLTIFICILMIIMVIIDIVRLPINASNQHIAVITMEFINGMLRENSLNLSPFRDLRGAISKSGGFMNRPIVTMIHRRCTNCGIRPKGKHLIYRTAVGDWFCRPCYEFLKAKDRLQRPRIAVTGIDFERGNP